MIKNGKELSLPDPDPMITPDRVLNLYINTYPELTTATISGPELKGTTHVYKFSSTVGTKG